MRARRGARRDHTGPASARRVDVTLDESEAAEPAPTQHGSARDGSPRDGSTQDDDPTRTSGGPRARPSDRHPSDARPSGLHRSGRRRWVWLAVPAVVVVALVVAQVVTDARDRARVAAVGRLPGVVEALDGPPELAWRAPPGARMEDAVRVDGVLVVQRLTEDHAVTLAGLDVTTGAVRWEREVVGPRAAWSGWAEAAPTPCDAVPDRTGVAACLVTDAGGDVVDGVWTTLPATTTRLLLLDATDGTVVAEHPVPAPAAWMAVSGTDALVAGVDGRTLQVRSVDLVDGDVGWSATAEVGETFTASDVRATLLDDSTLAVVRGRGATLVSTDGVVLRTVGAEAVGLQTGGSTAFRAVVSTALGAVVVGSSAGSTLVSGAGEVRVDGAPAPLTADDGSVPGLLLTRTPRLVAWDAQDGARRWEARVVDAQDATIVHGRVHVGTSNAVVTLDGTTGETLWRVRRPSATSAPVTDGRYLYVLGSRDGRHRSPYDLVALHLADGSEAWRTPMPDDVTVAPVAGLLVARSHDAQGGEVFQVLR